MKGVRAGGWAAGAGVFAGGGGRMNHVRREVTL